MKNPKSLICLTFGILFIGAALVLRGTGNNELVVTAILAGIFPADCLLPYAQGSQIVMPMMTMMTIFKRVSPAS